MTIIYRGFSTAQSAKNYSLTDYELVKQDLINYFNLRKGSKLMNPSFGTVIWDMLFEPLDENTQQVITNDITKILQYDPRLRIGQVAVTQQDLGFLVQLTLSYIPTNQTETINLLFNRNTNSLTVN